MPITMLTKKEKLVFYNLVKWPELNDKELSEKIGVKRSTITAIRNRLKRENFFETVAIPNLPAFGCRLLGVLYGKYNPLNPIKDKVKAEALKKRIKQPELVFVSSTGTEIVAVYAAEHLVDMRKVQDKFILDYEKLDHIEEVNRIYYPFELCHISSFFNFAPLLKHLFYLNTDEEGPHEPVWKQSRPVKLNKAEKLVLQAMIKNPEASNIELSGTVKKTRSTVSKTKKALISRGLVKLFNIPTLDKLGCELLVFFHAKMNPKYPLGSRMDGLELTIKKTYPLLHVSGDMESVGMVVPRNYTEYNSVYNEVISYYKEKGYIDDNPNILIMPVKQIKFKKLDFGPLVDRLLFKD